MIVRNTLFAVVVVAVLVGAIGCAPPEPTHFDRAGVAEIHRLAVLPMPSGDTNAGLIGSGLAVLYLQQARLPGVTVIEAPAMWRLSDFSGMSSQAAVEAGRQAEADAVLTGSIQYVSPVSDGAKASTSATVRILSVQTGQAVYINTGKGTDGDIPTAYRKAYAAALSALEKHLRKVRVK